MATSHRPHWHRIPHARPWMLAAALLPGLAGGAAQARAECACLCLDGTYQTVCRSLEAVRSSGSLCGARAGSGCPQGDGAAAGRRYGAAVAGAHNCRDARIFDPQSGGHVVAKVCDLAR